MGKYFYLLSAEGADGNAVFRAESASCASTGDLLKHNGEIFEITGTCYCSEDSDEYQMVAQLSKIREVDAIYTERWRNPKANEDDTCDRTNDACEEE